MTQYLFAHLKEQISIFLFHGDFPYNIIHCHEMKADPNNLIKLKAFYQTLFAGPAQFVWAVGGWIISDWPATKAPIKVPQLWGKHFLCPLHCRQRQKKIITFFVCCGHLIGRKVTATLHWGKISLEQGTIFQWLWVNAKGFLFYYNAINEDRDDSDPRSMQQTCNLLLPDPKVIVCTLNTNWEKKVCL